MVKCRLPVSKFDPLAKVGKQWMTQQVELNKDKQAKNAEEKAVKLRGYRILEELRTYPSVMYLEQLRESAIKAAQWGCRVGSGIEATFTQAQGEEIEQWEKIYAKI